MIQKMGGARFIYNVPDVNVLEHIHSHPMQSRTSYDDLLPSGDDLTTRDNFKALYKDAVFKTYSWREYRDYTNSNETIGSYD